MNDTPTPDLFEQFPNLLIAWIQTPDWAASEAYLRDHQAELLTDTAEAVLQALVQMNQGDAAITQHQALLRACRTNGIDETYSRFTQPAQETSPSSQALLDFLRADTDAAAEAILRERAAMLLTYGMHQQLYARVAQSEGEIRERLAARLALWDRVYGESASPAAGVNRFTVPGDSSDVLTRLDASPARFNILSASHVAIGDNAVTVNLVQGSATVPLNWKRPNGFQAEFTNRAIGREVELTAVHNLLSGGDAVVQSPARANSAVQGMPGVGKTTLAALYAERYAVDPTGDYPGGVVWLQFDPSITSEEAAYPVISRQAAYAYGGDPNLDQPLAALPQQVFALLPEGIVHQLKLATFAPDAVKMLLSGHGRMLIIADNVWHEEVLRAVRQMQPPDSRLLVTTRNLRVANNLARSYELNVLSEADALRLITDRLSAMSTHQAQALMRAVGRHPLALNVVLADLQLRGSDEWDATTTQIESMISEGTALDGLELPGDESDRPSLQVEKSLAFSLQSMSDDLRQRFLALGAFAREGNFDAEAAAALWDIDESTARGYLNNLAGRALLTRDIEHSGRWSQHGIIRYFGLILQALPARQVARLRHVEYYLKQMRAADDAQTYYRMAPELPQLRHAFVWSARESLALAQDLLGNCANLLQSLNLGGDYLTWADQVLRQAQAIGSSRQIASALTSRGNALQAAAVLVIGEQRTVLLKEALAAYDQALERRRDVPLAYAQTQNNRAVLLTDLATLPGEDRRARLMEALAAYDQALERQRDVPLDYAMTQGGLGNLYATLEDFPSALQALWRAAVGFEQVEHAPYIQQSRRILLAFKQSQGNSFAALWQETVGGDQPDWLAQSPARTATDNSLTAAAAQHLADLLIAWVQTPDWTASEAYLREHQAELLTDGAESVMDMLIQGNPGAQTLEQHLALLRACRADGIEIAYERRM